MKDLKEILEEINGCIDKLDTLKLHLTQDRVEILDKLSINYYKLTNHRTKFHEDWMSVYFNSKANSSAAKEREADKEVPELYVCQHFMSSTKLVIDGLRTSISAMKNG